WDCAPTRAQAERARAVVQDVSPLWLASFERHLRGVAVVDGRGAVHMILSLPGADGWVAAPPHRILSTVPTELSAAVRAAGGLWWRALGDFSVPGLAAQAPVLTHACAVPFA
ncbi:MAG TPA: hypothetical protein VFX28_20125, partial [Methylomirabilota bacterium]|nr:hypothetical protein [Methylomirabilota bacterium]